MAIEEVQELQEIKELLISIKSLLEDIFHEIRQLNQG